jgi:hypothetical protein
MREPPPTQSARPTVIRRNNRDVDESRPSPRCDDFMTKIALFDEVRPTGKKLLN